MNVTHVKCFETEILYGLFRYKSTEIKCQTDGNFPEEKPPDTESRKRLRTDILGLFEILLILKEIFETLHAVYGYFSNLVS